MEIGNWRCTYNKMNDEAYRETYLKEYEPSDPKEEWDDRNRMYCIYYNLLLSCNHAENAKRGRQTAYNDMYYLIDKYASFKDDEGPRRIFETDYASLSAERDHTSQVASW